MFVRDPGLAARFERLARDCGVDVTRQIKQVHLALAPGGTGAARRALLVATGRLDEPSLTRCLQAAVGGGGGDVTVKQPGPAACTGWSRAATPCTSASARPTPS
jgi:hypothetical protein